MKSHDTQTTLRYLADLAPTGGQTTDVISRTSDFAWLGGRAFLVGEVDESRSRLVRRSAELRRLAAVDSLHSAERLLRIGWLFLAGTVDWQGKPTRFCLPLLSVPVRLSGVGLEVRIIHEGDVEMPDDIFSEEARLQLEDSSDPYGGGSEFSSEELVARLGRLNLWVERALRYAELPQAKLLGADTDPVDIRNQPGLSVIPGAGVYTVRDVAAPNVAGVLRSWASQPLQGTAFDVMYGGVSNHAGSNSAEIRTPLPLNRSQREALERSRVEPITVVSGPPGTGKSHLVAAASIDEVARGNTVLIATQSTHAAEVIADLLNRHPGPRFVRFGNRDDRQSVAAELADGLAQPLSSGEYDRRNRAAMNAATRVNRTRGAIQTLLEREAAFTDGLRRREMNLLIASQVPAVLEDQFDVGTAETLLARANHRTGLLGTWRSNRAERQLRARARVGADITLDEIGAALDAAGGEAAVQRGMAGGGLSLTSGWYGLEHEELEYRKAIGLAIEAKRRSRRNSRRKSTRAVAVLASALRAGRIKRRQILKDLSGSDFLDVLPLWIGTLQDIDNTLPVAAGMFDVVIFDEASQIDQMRAAPALARAKRAMVVGDPRQLRHVSFVSDDAMEAATRDHQLAPDLARLLDVRRNSLFDAAAGVSPVTWLDEHFRSVPHIISFSDRRFYGGNLRLMTQHPSTETQDAIRTITIAGQRDDAGVNRTEIDEVISQVAAMDAAGETSIGVVSPFRAQADALEEAILNTFGPDDIDRLGLRVGTVHGFQGNERDVVIASLAIAPDDAAGSLRFLQNPNLFNVLITRARREMVVVTSTSIGDLNRGLLADYLRHAEFAPAAVNTRLDATGWTGEIHHELMTFGARVVPGYPVAGWSVDLAVGEGSEAIGVECVVHPDGADTHIEQHLALRRAGWEIVDAFQSRWLADPEGAAEMLSKELLRRVGR
jgi:hypothetical protein